MTRYKEGEIMGKILVLEQFMDEHHRAAIRAAAEKTGFAVQNIYIVGEGRYWPQTLLVAVDHGGHCAWRGCIAGRAVAPRPPFRAG